LGLRTSLSRAASGFLTRSLAEDHKDPLGGRISGAAGDACLKIRLHIACAIIASVSALIASSPVAAEKTPAADNFVFWPADEIPAGYRHMRDIFSTEVVRRDARETFLPPGPPLEISYRHDGVVKSIDDFVRENRVAGLLILHHGRIVLERYGLDQQPTDWTSNSVAKSFISTFVGAAIHDGAIGSVNDRMSKYIPELAVGSFADVTVRDALLMASGVGWNENYEDRGADSSKIRNLDFPGSTAPPEQRQVPGIAPRSQLVGQGQE